MEGIGILPAVLPGENTTTRHHRLRISFVQEVVAEVDAMTHPLVGDAAGKLLVETKFEIKLGIKRPVRFVHQPGPPIRILLADQRAWLMNKPQDRKSTRLNSSHVRISYAVFCLKKKKKEKSSLNIDT